MAIDEGNAEKTTVPGAGGLSKTIVIGVVVAVVIIAALSIYVALATLI